MTITTTSTSDPRGGSTPVLVVGAGPVGLSLACQLSRHGVACRVIERDADPTDQSRALGIWGRTLEVIDDMGVIDPVLDRSRRLRAMNLYSGGRRLARLEFDQDVEDAPYPYLVALPQGETQRILADRLEDLGVKVEWATTLTALRQTADGVTATIVGPADREQTIQAAWLVGCDGARSLVRHELGVAFEGSEYEETFLLGDLRIDWALPDDEAHAFLVEGGGALAAFPLPEAGRWRLIDATGAVTADDPALIQARLGDLLRGQGHPEARSGEPRWCSSFRIHRRLARAYRLGRCLLAGDAAHIHSPVGGQGMNTGIQDAHNLAWKLALVVSGGSPESLLDSYETERRPVAQSILRATDLMTRAITSRRPITRSIRDGLVGLLYKFGFVRRQAARRLSELDIGYPRSPIVAEDRTSLLQALVASNGEPNLLIQYDFGRGPKPGSRAPNLAIEPDEPGPRRLLDILREPGHALLVFEGREPSPGSAAVIEALGDLARDRVGGRITPWLVGRPGGGGSFGPIRWEGARLPDPSGRLHQHFGARGPCLYLIRPDGHVGYRAQPPDAGKLAAYLGRIIHAKA